jgi:hypothetical protein
MKARVPTAFLALAFVAVPFVVAGILVFAQNHGPADLNASGLMFQNEPRPGLTLPPVKRDPRIDAWLAGIRQQVDRTLKMKLAAADEARRSRQLKQAARLRADALGARVLPPTTPPTEPLRLVSIDPSQGEPGDHIRFYLNRYPGTSDAVFEAHFIVAQGRDESSKGRLGYTQDRRWVIDAELSPSIRGLMAHNGRAYVKVDAKPTNGVPFTFNPTIIYETLHMSRMEWLNDSNVGGHFGGWIDAGLMYHNAAPLLGDKDDDEWWRFTKLKNGWVVDEAGVWGIPNVNNIPWDCSVTASRIGTDSPYIKVHWWFNDGAGPLMYTIVINVKGPSGLPYK